VAGERRGPSRTAAYVALFRALETRLPDDQRLFSDPFAESFLDGRLGAALKAAKVPVTGAIVPEVIDRRWPGPRTSVLVRTRFIDDAVEAAVDDGVEQIVILGAGFDARGYRLDAASRARVFEVDEAGTQEVKRRAIEKRLGSIPPHVTYVTVDFERDDLGAALRDAGLDAARRVMFVWEGVTPYLTPEAVDATLRLLPTLGAPGSRVVFTYLDRAGLDRDGDELTGSAAAMQRAAAVGEPFRWGLDPKELPSFLSERGLELIETATSVELSERYLKPLGRTPPTSPFFRVVLAGF
jgi:methyltransferase (TIGR00027 family)